MSRVALGVTVLAGAVFFITRLLKPWSPREWNFPLAFQTERQNSLGPWTKPEEGFVSQKGFHAAPDSLGYNLQKGSPVGERGAGPHLGQDRLVVLALVLYQD